MYSRHVNTSACVWTQLTLTHCSAETCRALTSLTAKSSSLVNEQLLHSLWPKCFHRLSRKFKCMSFKVRTNHYCHLYPAAEFSLVIDSRWKSNSAHRGAYVCFGSEKSHQTGTSHNIRPPYQPLTRTLWNLSTTASSCRDCLDPAVSGQELRVPKEHWHRQSVYCIFKFTEMFEYLCKNVNFGGSKFVVYLRSL